jgi:DNA-directed RNA polymerase subunit beta'
MAELNIAKQTKELTDVTMGSIKGLFPVAGKAETLHLTKIWADDNLDPTDYQSQFKAKVGERTWGIPIYGSFELRDKAGKISQKSAKVRLVTLPKPTPRYSFIIKGSEHQIANQLRLRPAGYTVRSLTGGVKSQINLSKGYSGQIEIHASPETGVFRLKVGQARQRLYPILNALGVSDRELSKRWGQEVLDTNKNMRRVDYDTAVRSFAKSVTKGSFKDTEAAAEAIRSFVQTTEMDPDVNKRTLGKAHGQMSGAFLTDMSSNLLGVLRGEEEPHDRNSLEFKEYRKLQDLIEERLSMGEFKGKITRKIANNINTPGREKINDIVDPTVIGPQIEAVFNLPELHQLPKQLNPLDMLNTASLVTVMGPGGIQDVHTITDDMRNVHPSHLGFLDPVHTPESDKVGVIYHLPVGIETRNKTLLTRAINARTGKLERIDPAKFADAVVAFPGQYDKEARKWKNSKEVMVLGEKNKTKTVKASQVDYILQSPKQAFSFSSNLMPFLPTNSGGRTLVASKLAEQAVPLKGREQPLVQSRIGGKVTFEEMLGDAFSFKSPVSGTVARVSKDKIVIKGDDGERHTVSVYDNFPLNYKSFIDATTKVAKGDAVKRGQVLADTNFTDNGVLALGKNLRTAYLPYKGYNFEDGIVITQDASKSLTSEHMHVEGAQESERTLIDKEKFIANYPNVYNKDQISRLDSRGVVKKGTVLQPGDPIIASLRKEEIDPDNLVFGKLSRTLMRPWKDHSTKWKSDVPGKVVDVIRHGNKVKVYVRTEEPAQIGDKLVGRFGNKGIITKVIPTEHAPQDKDGRPVDIMFNPHGIITRVNIGQILENAASKVSEKTGKPYVVDNFSGENYTKSIKDLLKSEGISDTEELTDPETGKSLGKVNVGSTYILKLEKQVRSQFSARGAGPGWRYSQNTQEPIKGGEAGSKALDLLTFYSMLAHGSRSNLREMATYKASRNDDFWNAIKTGAMLPPPKPTFAYDKFLAYMKGAGVNVTQEGTKNVLGPMTDREIDNLSNGAIKDYQFVRAKDLAELKGGLMDKKITGGLRGTHWSHIPLTEPVVNPVFEGPVRTLLDIDRKTYDGLIDGRIYVAKDGTLNEEEDGVTSGKAFQSMLGQIDIAKKMREFRAQARKAKTPAALNKANKGIRYVEALKKFNLNPSEAYVLTKIPVLPPVYRPVYALPDGNLHTSPVNFLYRDLGLVNQKLKAYNDIAYMPESEKQSLRRDLYTGVASVAGLTDKTVTFYARKQKPKGIITEIKGVKGQGSKSGFFQRHVLRREQDLVGRGTIIPEPKLGVDEVGIPEEMAWNIFQPFVMRELVNQGYKAIDADKAIEDRSYIAQQALGAVMNERPVMLNRSPSLHKFSLMSFNPKLTSGRAIKIPPLIVKGFNADFDGDAMTVHVPVLPDAISEARKMLPSQHLFNPGTGQIMMSPSQEAAIGLFFLTRDGKPVPKKFATTRALRNSLDNGSVTVNNMVRVAGKKTSAGRALVDAVLPAAYRGRNQVLDKKALGGLLSEIASNDPKEYSKTVDQLAALGNEHAYQSGFTVSIDDVQPNLPGKEKILAKAHAAAGQMDDAGKVKLYEKVDRELKSLIKKNLGAQGNNLYQMVQSGARGNIDQLKQIVSAPLLVEDVTGETLPLPITGSFSHGLSIGDYWNSLYGARRGVVDKQLQTSKPGEFNKDLMATVVKNQISSQDCMTSKGLDFSVEDIDAQDRVLVGDISVGSKVIAKSGDIVTPNLINKFRSAKVKKVKVRSPITCKMPAGTCAMCYGLNPDGDFASIGDNIGAISGQSMTEPLTQMVLRSMHTGGVAGAQQLTGYEKIDKLIRMPKVIVGKATLAEREGKISAIEDAPAGGKNVFIGDQKHFIGVGNPLKVRLGSKVRKGDPLSDGLVQPRELVDLKGMLPTQQYLVDEITGAYRGTGVPLRKKNVEAVIRSLTDTTQVMDGGDSPYLFGDIIPYTMAESFNESAHGKVSVQEAFGKPLHKDHGPVKKGTKVSKRVSKILENLGYNEVAIGPDPIMHKPFVDGVKQLPMLSKDWMSQMGYGRLVQGIKQGAGEAWSSDIHGFSPVPAFAYGAEFGQGKKGKY